VVRLAIGNLAADVARQAACSRQGRWAIRESHQERSSRQMSSPSNSMQQEPIVP
jgi:hypothetical protein